MVSEGQQSDSNTPIIDRLEKVKGKLNILEAEDLLFLQDVKERIRSGRHVSDEDRAEAARIAKNAGIFREK